MIKLNTFTTEQLVNNSTILNNRIKEFHLRMKDMWDISDYATSNKLDKEFKQLTNTYHQAYNEPTLYEQLEQISETSINTVFNYADKLKIIIEERGI